MQKILGYIRKACEEFNLIEDGDRIAVGVSGGKDSLVLLAALAELRRFERFNFELCAITLDQRFGGTNGNYGKIAEMCEKLNVEYKVIESDISEIVFNVRKEKNPCSLCAKMRRGALHDAAKEMGCNKIALAHHFDDVVETFIMNLFREGRVGCFSPKTYLSRKDITMIRPLIFAPEVQVAACARKYAMPVEKSQCPADKDSERYTTKQWLAERERADNGFKARIFGALRRSGVNGWH